MSRASPSAPRWEAILSAVELDPGHWHMHAGNVVDEDPYACIWLFEIDVKDRGRLKRYRVLVRGMHRDNEYGASTGTALG